MRAAQRMLERFGDEAVREIDLRIVELRQHEEPGALALWQEVREAVLKLRREGPGGTRH